MSGEEANNCVDERNTKDALPQDKQDVINHLQEIVGGLDYNECVKVMEENEWNLEQAVHRIMDIPLANTENISEPPSLSGYQLDSSIAREMEREGVRRRNVVQNINVDNRPFNQKIIRQFPSSQIAWYWQALYLLWSPFRKLMQMFWYFVTAFQQEPRLGLEDPLGDVRHFIDVTVAPLLAPASADSMPPFEARTYGDCIADAKSQLRFLIIYLHDDTSECLTFLREALCGDEVTRLVIEEGALLWGCSVQRSEGYRVARLLRQTSRYPFVGVVGLGRSGRMALLARLEGGGFTSPELSRHLRQLLRECSPALEVARADRRDRATTQSLRRQQDRDYAESLRLDREKEEGRRRQEAVINEQEEQRRQHEHDAVQVVLQREKNRLRVAALLPPQPTDKDIQEETLLVRLRLPTGTTTQFRFYKHDSIKMLYYHIMALSESPVNFEIHTVYPRSKWPVQPSQLEATDTEPTIDRRSRIGKDDPPSFQEFGVTDNIALVLIDLDA